MNARISKLKESVQASNPAICPERPLIWTAYFKKKKNRKKPVPVQIAEATGKVLREKTVKIYPGELLVGNYTSKRVGGITYPELHGLTVLAEIFKIHKRTVNPLGATLAERLRLASIVPFWIKRNIPVLAFDSNIKRLAFLINQMKAHEYQIYEAAGLAHLAPDYEKLIRLGTSGFIKEIKEHQEKNEMPENRGFYEAMEVSAHALAAFGERYALKAATLAETEANRQRKAELKAIAKVCKRVPRHGARNFHEALQSMLFAHLALFQESTGETICPGRIDQFLWPYYEKDLQEGRISRNQAKELLSAFVVKMSETIPAYSQLITKTNGGLNSYQVVTVGGVDKNGKDATNELSAILLEIMDEMRMPQPNYHIRIHEQTPPDFFDQVMKNNLGEGGAPAMYNDEVIVQAMTKAGYDKGDARNYTAIGCVEPTAPGKTLGSTDAAIINLPLVLELALNEGRQYGSKLRMGAKPPPVSTMGAMEDVSYAFLAQLKHQMKKLHADLQALEVANAKFHPTPLTSMLIDGCIEKGVCSTAGGATYNFSGIQGVGVTTVGDSLYAIEKAVFVDKKLSLPELIQALKQNLHDVALHRYLQGLAKFGNDDPDVDKWTRWVVDAYAGVVDDLGKNTRGGKYNAGIYSNTTHVHFGSIVGALPNGRKQGEPFASGMSPENGADRNGPTALVNSMNRLDFTKLANGINFNMKFSPLSVKGNTGAKLLGAIVSTYFQRGGMQVQTNMLDPELLKEAKVNPDRYPYLLVRVAGYSAYFNDLSPQMKDEIIARSTNTL